MASQKLPTGNRRSSLCLHGARANSRTQARRLVAGPTPPLVRLAPGTRAVARPPIVPRSCRCRWLLVRVPTLSHFSGWRHGSWRSTAARRMSSDDGIAGRPPRHRVQARPGPQPVLTVVAVPQYCRQHCRSVQLPTWLGRLRSERLGEVGKFRYSTSARLEMGNQRYSSCQGNASTALTTAATNRRTASRHGMRDVLGRCLKVSKIPQQLVAAYVYTSLCIPLMQPPPSGCWTLEANRDREGKGTQVGKQGDRRGKRRGREWEMSGTEWESSGTEAGKWGYWDASPRMMRAGGER